MNQSHLLAPVTAEGTALVLISDGSTLPRIAWVGPYDEQLTAEDVAASVGPVRAAPDVHSATGRSVSVLPEVGELWFGRPGLAGHRLDGRDWTTDFRLSDLIATEHHVTIEADDRIAGLSLTTELEAVAGGLLRLRHTLDNTGDGDYVVDHLDVTVPIGTEATELLDLTGRWGRERMPQRQPILDGSWLREGRTGKTGHDAVTMLTVGRPGFGFGHGAVWGAHLAWSGNTRQFAQRQPSGVLTVGGGELLLGGEVVLAPGESYETPWLYLGASADGLDGLAAQFHQYLRSLPAHPKLPRPVTANVWEAVYFDHDLDRLRELADRSAEIGVERFVLDDGWFGGRRSDRAGLGDWVVSEQAWPDGLDPLIEHVLGRGLRFGLWFEPEMINRDSELFREHPDWILGPARQPDYRNQLVLDVGRPEVRDHLLAQIDSVLDRYPISYVKWDHNRSLADSSSAARHGGAGTRAQTLGFYALLDELRRRHPDVEWESCASGGGRIDLEVLQRAERVWTSDMTDALSRQFIQRWTAQLVPPEYLGAHVSAPQNHQTGRQLTLDFRAATAFFGDLGVEWDVTAASDSDRRRLADWISAYKTHRALLHTGRMFRSDLASEAILVHGVVAADRGQALVCYAQLDETVPDPVPFRVPGLDPARRYTAREVLPRLDWAGEGIELSGAALASVGLPAPARQPQHATVVHLGA